MSISFSLSCATTQHLVFAQGTVDPPAAPTAAGALVDQVFTELTGGQSYDTSGDFVGTNLVYSLVAPAVGVSINGGTGEMLFDTQTMAVQVATPITVRAANVSGSVTSGFALTLEATPVDPTTSVTFALDAEQQTVTLPAPPGPPTFTLSGDTAAIRSA